MPRDITVTFADGSQHVYQNAPDDVTPEQVQARASQEFKQPVTALDGGRGTPADTRRPEDVGFFEGLGAATKKGFEGLGDVASGLGLAGTSVFGSKEDTAKKMAAIKADQDARKDFIREQISPTPKVSKRKQNKVESVSQEKQTEVVKYDSLIANLERQKQDLLNAVLIRQAKERLEQEIAILEAKRLAELDDEESILALFL